MVFAYRAVIHEVVEKGLLPELLAPRYGVESHSPLKKLLKLRTAV